MDPDNTTPPPDAPDYQGTADRPRQPEPLDHLAEEQNSWMSKLLTVLTAIAAICGAIAVLWAAAGYASIRPFGTGELSGQKLNSLRTQVLALGGAAAVAGGLFVILQWRFGRAVRRGFHDHARAMDEQTGRRRILSLLVVSLLGLFLEVCLIRWHSTEFRAAAYFKNVTLLACFLGLGLGFAIAGRRRSYFPLTMGLLAGHVVIFDFLSRMKIDSIIRHPHTASGLWFWSVDNIEESASLANVAGQLAIFYGFFLAIFVTTILIFIPIGQLTGRMMKTLPPVRAYTINIIGSIAGVLLFTAISFLWLPPVFWFGLAGVMIVYLIRTHRGGLALAAPFMIALLVWVGGDWGHLLNVKSYAMQDIYSPYQRLELQPYHVVDRSGHRLHRGTATFANKSYHLRAADLSDDWIEAHGTKFPWVARKAAGYNLPYELAPEAREVLVIGAGAGNDVAAALRKLGRPPNVVPEESRPTPELHIDAVEIDPAIHVIGKRHHPEQPYHDPRVTVHIDDARHFMKRTTRKYDLIVFGLVDSHTLLSGMSNLRLDNFVYTRQSFAEAKGLLTPGGTLALSFCTGPDHPVSLRIYKMLRDLFPEAPPRAFYVGADGGTVFVAGGGVTTAPQLTPLAAEAEATRQFEAMDATAFPVDTTDDWPFLYMAKQEVPNSYIWLLVILAAISVFWILGISGGGTGLSGHFFFLGAAFLLIEVKGITELALVWGTTWVVNSVVITAILVFILFANMYVTRVRPERLLPYYVALLASLGLGYLFHIESLLNYSWNVAAFVSAALLLVPLFFAGVIFATSLKSCASVPAAFASNLIGAILGGLCEYTAMALGFRAMYLLGLGLYAASYLCLLRTRAPGKQALPPMESSLS